MNEKYLTIREVAQILGVTPLTLRNWDKKGLLAAARNPINNYRMYRYSDIADFVVEMQTQGRRSSAVQKLRVTAED